MSVTELDACFVLHYRLYRETSLLVDLLSQQHGRVTVVARGARRKHCAFKGLLQPFTPLFATWVGRRELKTLRSVEAKQASYRLNGRALWCGLYVNEILLRLLQAGIAFPVLFQRYEETLVQLAGSHNDLDALERCLRLFERDLLQALGYGLQLTHVADTGLPIVADNYYYYEFEHGFREQQEHSFGKRNYRGSSLLALQQGCLDDAATLADVKRLLRSVFTLLLGNKPLKSKELFMQV